MLFLWGLFLLYLLTLTFIRFFLLFLIFSLCPGSYSPLLLLSLLNYFFPSLPPTLCSFPPSFLSFLLPPSFVLLNIFLLPSSPSTSSLPLPICYLAGSSHMVPILNYSFHILNNPWLQICRGAFTISAAFGSRRHVTQFSVISVHKYSFLLKLRKY